MTKKIVYLFLALLLPGLVFLFLKKFGKNEFALPTYYQHGVDSLNTLCGTVYSQPYQLPDSVLKKTGWQQRPASIFVFQNEAVTNEEFKRVFDSFDSQQVQVVEVNAKKMSRFQYTRWSSCVFMVGSPRNAVLVDSNKRIRGYYAIGSREETDRLMLEVEILLKKY